MANFDLQSLIWLINNEIISAVQLAESDAKAAYVDSVRVRMGQTVEEAEKLSNGAQPVTLDLDKFRYPPAEKGWLVDVSYKMNNVLTDVNSSALTDNASLDDIPPQWLGISGKWPVEVLSGIGVSRVEVLNHNGIDSIERLGNLTVKSDLLAESWVRKAQTSARLVLALPPISLSQEVLAKSVFELQATLEPKEMLNWLNVLELCLDNDFLASKTLFELIHVD